MVNGGGRVSVFQSVRQTSWTERLKECKYACRFVAGLLVKAHKIKMLFISHKSAWSSETSSPSRLPLSPNMAPSFIPVEGIRFKNDLTV